jgi:hypothetical protein
MLGFWAGKIEGVFALFSFLWFYLLHKEMDLVVLNCPVGPLSEDGALTHQCCKRRGLNCKMAKLGAIAM